MMNMREAAVKAWVGIWYVAYVILRASEDTNRQAQKKPDSIRVGNKLCQGLLHQIWVITWNAI